MSSDLNVAKTFDIKSQYITHSYWWNTNKKGRSTLNEVESADYTIYERLQRYDP